MNNADILEEFRNHVKDYELRFAKSPTHVMASYDKYDKLCKRLWPSETLSGPKDAWFNGIKIVPYVYLNRTMIPINEEDFRSGLIMKPREIV